MVAFNFQKQFAEAVEVGPKRQTIRGKARCKTGDRLQLYVGQRTRACRRLGDAKCASVRTISCMSEHNRIGRPYIRYLRDRDICACRDGFQGWDELRRWFDDTHTLPFNGWLIEWEG